LRIVVPDNNEQFLRDGQIDADIAKVETATGTWVVTSAHAYEGSFSLRSQIINENSVASVQVSRSYGAGTLRFAYKVSSEQGFDKFRFFINDEQQLQADGEVDWTEVSYELSASDYVLRWEYDKDGSISEGVDTAWIDGLVFEANPPAPPANPPPADDSSGGGSTMPFILWLLLVSIVARIRPGF
jgi:hypothetical protein